MARWIAWNANRPMVIETQAETVRPEAEPVCADNVIWLFRKTA
ncbi:hypothetical protein [Methylobacterium sp. C25]|nr:hypothetical protein [Methylobacterium sp. C25]